MRTTFAVFNPDLEGNFQSIFVLGTDGNLWLEHGPFGNVPPGRVQVDATVATFQAPQIVRFEFGAWVYAMLVLGTDGNLWAANPPFGQVPPPRVQVDATVQAFAWVAFSGTTSPWAQTPFVLGTDGNLWQVLLIDGEVPPRRALVDGNVRAFDASRDGSGNMFLLDTSGKLWLKHPRIGAPPPLRELVDENVQAFQASWLPSGHVYVLSNDGHLWVDHPPFGSVPPRRTLIDTNVIAFQGGYFPIGGFPPQSSSYLWVLTSDGNLWRESAPQPPPSQLERLPEPALIGILPLIREHVDQNVRSFTALNDNTVLVLAMNGDLWREAAPFGAVPPPNRTKIDANVAH